MSLDKISTKFQEPIGKLLDNHKEIDMMTDESSIGSQVAIPDKRNSDLRRAYRDYSIEDKVIALATVDMNGGNIYRTAKASNIPYATLYGWVEEQKQAASGYRSSKEKNVATSLPRWNLFFTPLSNRCQAKSRRVLFLKLP